MTTYENRIDKCFQLSKSIEKNIHLLDKTTAEHSKSPKTGYSKHVVMSDCIEFLEAIKNDVGGEIIQDSELGTFLYLENISNN